MIAVFNPAQTARFKGVYGKVRILPHLQVDLDIYNIFLTCPSSQPPCTCFHHCWSRFRVLKVWIPLQLPLFVEGVSGLMSVILWRLVNLLQPLMTLGHKAGRYCHVQCILSYFLVSIVHRTLTWTTGSLTCIYIYISFCMRIHTEDLGL